MKSFPPWIFSLHSTSCSPAALFPPGLRLPCMLHDAVAPKDNLPALHWAAMKGYLPLVQSLLNIFPVDLSNDSGDTVRHGATRSCHMLVTEYLLFHDAAVNRTDHYGCTALTYAWRGGL